MKGKIWYRTEIFTPSEQDIRIQPSEEGETISLSFKEKFEGDYQTSLHLNESSLEALIAKLREMMEHVKGESKTR
jgi:hypothetical protein